MSRGQLASSIKTMIDELSPLKILNDGRLLDMNPVIPHNFRVFADQCGCNRAFSGSGGRKLAMTLSLR